MRQFGFCDVDHNRHIEVDRYFGVDWDCLIDRYRYIEFDGQIELDWDRDVQRDVDAKRAVDLMRLVFSCE